MHVTKQCKKEPYAILKMTFEATNDCRRHLRNNQHAALVTAKIIEYEPFLSIQIVVTSPLKISCWYHQNRISMNHNLFQ